jgi:hypothetical protein
MGWRQTVGGPRVVVTVRVIGELSRFADAATVEVNGVGISLGSAIDEIVERNPRLGQELFDDQGRLRYTSLLVLNGQSAAWPEERDKPIEDGGGVVFTRLNSGG